jgi:hypothetical protein
MTMKLGILDDVGGNILKNEIFLFLSRSNNEMPF